MYPEVHKVSKRLRTPEEVEVVDREGSQVKREDKETAIYPTSVTCDHGRRPGYLAGYLLKNGLPSLWVESDRSSHRRFCGRFACARWHCVGPSRVVSRFAPDRRPARWLAQGQ